jgi:hypothetical protein
MCSAIAFIFFDQKINDMSTDPENNILEITREFQCPDPLSKVIYRIEDIE